MLNFFDKYRQDDTCCVCGKHIYGGYWCDAYGNKACQEHSVVMCASCSRICSSDMVSIGQGRYVCKTCHDRIPDEDSCKRITSFVKKTLAGLGLTIPNFTLSRVSMDRLYEFQHNNAVTGLATAGGNGYEIYILKDIVNTTFAEILAHEMTHLWQWEQHVTVRDEIVEGFCNLSSFIVLKAIDTELARVKVRELEANPDKIYGDGFRKVKQFYDANGMEKTIAKMKRAGKKR